MGQHYCPSRSLILSSLYMNTFQNNPRRHLLTRVTLLRISFLLIWASAAVASAAPSNSIARVWNERALAAIRQDTPHPPGQARNYFSYSVCMYDAWAAYDPTA